MKLTAKQIADHVIKTNKEIDAGKYDPIVKGHHVILPAIPRPVPTKPKIFSKKTINNERTAWAANIKDATTTWLRWLHILMPNLPTPTQREVNDA